MDWVLSHRADWQAREIADRHYNRQSIGAKQFVPPGRCTVLKAESDAGKALWVTSWPFPEYTHHAWPGAWICSAFRNEGFGIASELIVQAIAATRFDLGEPPPEGIVTFLDTNKVRPTKVRGKNLWGWTWLKCGFELVGTTKERGHLAFHLPPNKMPPPMAARMPISF